MITSISIDLIFLILIFVIDIILMYEPKIKILNIVFGFFTPITCLVIYGELPFSSGLNAVVLVLSITLGLITIARIFKKGTI